MQLKPRVCTAGALFFRGFKVVEADLSSFLVAATTINTIPSIRTIKATTDTAIVPDNSALFCSCELIRNSSTMNSMLLKEASMIVK